MSNTLNVDVEGFDQLINRLKQIDGDKTKRREALIILRQIAKPTLVIARNLVPVSKGKASSNIARYRRQGGDKRLVSKMSGRLKKSIGLITGRSKENATVYIGPRVKGAFRNYDKSGWYGHFVHDGHNIYRKGYKRDRTGTRISKKKGTNYLVRARLKNSKAALTRTKGNPFLTRAYEQTEGKVTKEAEAKFGKFVQRRLNKLQ